MDNIHPDAIPRAANNDNRMGNQADDNDRQRPQLIANYFEIHHPYGKRQWFHAPDQQVHEQVVQNINYYESHCCKNPWWQSTPMEATIPILEEDNCLATNGWEVDNTNHDGWQRGGWWITGDEVL